MNPSSSSSPPSRDDPPWSEHALQITTPEHKYIHNSDNSTDEGFEYTGPPLPWIYHSSSMVSSSSGDIYIFGGEKGTRLRNDTWAMGIYGGSDLPLEQERKPRHMTVTAGLVETTGTKPSPRNGHQSALVGGLFIVWGGVTSIVNGNPSPPDDNSVYALNITTHHWTKLDIRPAPSARAGHAACMCGNQFTVFGGRLKPGKFLNDLWRIDLGSHRIEYPENGQEITLKPTLPLKQSGSAQITDASDGDRYDEVELPKGSSHITEEVASETLDNKSTGLETNGDGMSQLALILELFITSSKR
ncbi:unnamed protein product [Rhizoctonia solani]|uniref:Uncharacterized protein n=1 Tax=Rhizoctonia solani TaxID=456999 RepID=A0A8H3HU76_9AGAM|nr:unnamed protein product [Rhizoctonia solani]